MRDETPGAGRDTAWCEMQAEMQRRILSMFALPPDAFVSDRNQNYSYAAMFSYCPPRAYNPRCLSDDPCTGASRAMPLDVR